MCSSDLGGQGDRSDQSDQPGKARAREAPESPGGREPSGLGAAARRHGDLRAWAQLQPGPGWANAPRWQRPCSGLPPVGVRRHPGPAGGKLALTRRSAMAEVGPAHQRLREHLHQTRLLGSINSALYYDQNTVMPEIGRAHV